MKWDEIHEQRDKNNLQITRDNTQTLMQRRTEPQFSSLIKWGQ